MGVLNRAPAPIDTDRPAAADFVRVLATWAVGAFHIWQQSWYGGAAPAHWLRAGSVGVDLLVMLSAFCLFLPWANAAVRDQPLPRSCPPTTPACCSVWCWPWRGVGGARRWRWIWPPTWR